ncbi:F-box/FBD/LRR-repeat protein At1g13570-like [Vicia villosa]|uniref:F-box/FBD/LRR-repeat protein At1g13570-like n=1 Tax=Vicia villosa TaxID=3911 RepID=UPI00273AB864|nr:F-box/FBD/LRR-repeat protein At1g13570-like [Vicia villosa]
MTMPNKKANQSDRISDLPSNVVDGILANLKIRDLVRTSILSKKWRYTWTSAPHLCFDVDFYQRFRPPEDPEPVGFDDDFDPWFWHLDNPYPDRVICKTITDVLMLHNGPIHKFSIHIPERYRFRLSTEKLNMWIPFMSRDIKHLELLTYQTEEDPQYPMLDILLSCKELTCFKLRSFNLSIPPNFCGFKKLRELHLYYIQFEPRALESFISSCPVLEKLNIEYCEIPGCDYLVISSPSLKVLVLDLIDIESICLKEARSLIDFTLTGYLAKGFIKVWPKIKRFSLDCWEKIVDADVIPSMLLTGSFSSLEYLKLDELNFDDKGDILYFVSLLKSAPNLIELVIKHYYVGTRRVLGHLEELESDSCCLKLQTVKIYIGASSHHAMSLIKFILANSPLLKTLTLYRIYDEFDAPILLNFLQDLLRMKRASPAAQVDFLHSTYGQRHLIIGHDKVLDDVTKINY